MRVKQSVSQHEIRQLRPQRRRIFVARRRGLLGHPIQLPAAMKRRGGQDLPTERLVTLQRARHVARRHVDRAHDARVWVGAPIFPHRGGGRAPGSQGASVALIAPLHGEGLLPSVGLWIVPRVNDQAVHVARPQLLQDPVDVARLVVLGRAHRLAGPEGREEVPRDDLRFVAAAESLEHAAECDPLRLVGRVDPGNALIQTQLDDCRLLLRRGRRIAAQLMDEGVPAENQRHFDRRAHGRGERTVKRPLPRDCSPARSIATTS